MTSTIRYIDMFANFILLMNYYFSRSFNICSNISYYLVINQEKTGMNMKIQIFGACIALTSQIFIGKLCGSTS